MTPTFDGMTRTLVRRHYQLPIEFFGGIHQCAYLNEYLDNKTGILRNNLDRPLRHLMLSAYDDHNEGS